MNALLDWLATHYCLALILLAMSAAFGSAVVGLALGLRRGQ